MPLGFFSTALHDVLVQVQVLAVFGELSHNVIHAGLLLVPGVTACGVRRTYLVHVPLNLHHR